MFRSGFIGKRAARFQRDEDGSLIVFSLFIFMTMIVFGGVAIDLMLYENRRTHVQNSTDRAVLAAANLKQANKENAVGPKTIVVDYLAKVGIYVSEDDVTVNENSVTTTDASGNTNTLVTGRLVSVTVDAASDPLLIDRWLGIEQLPYGATSNAEESVNDVEVSLILDVSGSMGNPASKLTNMQNAAKTFVNGVLEGAEDDRVSVSLVPYSTQVAVGEELMQRLTTEHNHDFSHCVNFTEADFRQTGIQRWQPSYDSDGNPVYDGDGNQVFEEVPLSQTASFDPFRHYSYGRSHRYPVCRNEDYVEILPWSNNASALTERIDDFTAFGNTSIDVAVKWGAALLDPSMNSHLNSMRTDPDISGDPDLAIDAAFIPRPHEYTYPDSLKFMVVMTDGINTTQYRLEDEYKEGMSNIYWAWNDHWMAVEQGGNVNFWNLDDRCWHYQNNKTCNGTRTPSEDDRLTKLEMWHDMTMGWRAYNGFYRRTWQAQDYYDAIYDPRVKIEASAPDIVGPDGTVTKPDTKDNRLLSICEAAKQNEVVIFTIGFEVTDESADIMEKCASTDQHFYRVTGQDIQYAFESIKNKINQLKLVQ